MAKLEHCAKSLARLWCYVTHGAAPNAVAFEGTGENSPFTASVLDAFSQPGVTIQEALIQVSAQVQQDTNFAQQPFTQSNLTRPIYFSSEADIEHLNLKYVAPFQNRIIPDLRLPPEVDKFGQSMSLQFTPDGRKLLVRL